MRWVGNVCRCVIAKQRKTPFEQCNRRLGGLNRRSHLMSIEHIYMVAGSRLMNTRACIGWMWARLRKTCANERCEQAWATHRREARPLGCPELPAPVHFDPECTSHEQLLDLLGVRVRPLHRVLRRGVEELEGSVGVRIERGNAHGLLQGLSQSSSCLRQVQGV